MNKFSFLIILVISFNLSAQKNKSLKDFKTEFGYLSDTTIGGNLTVNGLSNLNGQVSVASDLSVDGSIEATAFIGDGSQLTNLSVSSPFSLNDTTGTGIQSATNTASGNYSIAMGSSTSAIGTASTSMGIDSEATGAISLATGNGTSATGQSSFSGGEYSEASGRNSISFGSVTKASGIESTAFGKNTLASGARATAFGNGSLASGITATAFGSSTASGNSSFAVGNSTASGDGSIALLNANASGDESVAIGRSVMAEGQWSIALGSGQAIASGDYSTALGYSSNATGKMATAISRTSASGVSSTSMGYSTGASGDYSTSMGFRTAARDYNSLVIGRYNLLGSTVTNSATEFSKENTAFVIGNGADADNRSDALTVLFDGSTTIAGDLSINSDARLKANIISLGSTLAKLLQIDGKTYTMKKDENKKQKIGLLAQDIEKVFPELVSESHGVKSVNYQGLVPVLINALKEQENKMNEQEARIERLEKLLLNS